MNNSQKTKIRELLNTGRKICSTEITRALGERIIDYRARISSIRKDLRVADKTVFSEPCRGRCGVRHDAPVNWYWIGNLGISIGASPIKDICVNCGWFMNHAKNCESLVQEQKELQTLW